MSFCPIPHTSRDQAWLGIGAALGASLLYCIKGTRRPECPLNVSPLAHGPVRVCVEFNDVMRQPLRSRNRRSSSSPAPRRRTPAYPPPSAAAAAACC